MLNTIVGKNYIDGKWITVDDTIDVVNPANNKIIGYIPNLNDQQILSTIDIAVKKFKVWSNTTIDTRADFLNSWYNLVVRNKDELANLLTLEQGKPLPDAKSEIEYSASFIKWYASTLLSLHGTIRDSNNSNQKIITEYEPIGPVLAITPWNFPSAMVTRKVAPALAVGCSVILKPSEFTPFSALALASLAEQAGLFGGVFNVITGDAEQIGKIACDDFRIRKLSFTGSTKVGKILYKQSANSLKRLSLELGGNAPFIIFADSNIEKAADELIKSKIRSSSQSCISPNRIFIHESIYDKFIKMLQGRVAKIKVGDGFDTSSDIGPLINKNAVDKILMLLADATSKGGIILSGGSARDNYLEPTLLVNCNDEMSIFNTEIFGFVIACYKFNDYEEVINRANNTEYGLQAYIYSGDTQLASNAAANLEFSMVAINNASPSNAKASFGGRKASGFGTEGGDLGVFEYLQTKYLSISC